jgi:lipid II:glycine glycyltransferase (peptidoglycan interpeptide bridge formation enzyme)
MIRKAQKSGVSIQYGNERELLHRFKEIYDATMTKDNAEQYYYFDESFYDSINNDLKSNYQVFYAKYNELVIAMSIFIYANNNMHYHLSGSDSSFRHLAPTNLLIYEAARWGCRQGFNSLHLGGGLGSGEDNLFKFKKAFNPTSANQFSIGKQIVDEEKYEFLKELRKNNDPDFNSESHFFPVYRA